MVVKKWKIRKSDKASNDLSNWISDYFKNNLIKAFTAMATLFGLCAIYAYHLHIEYFPSFDIQSLASMIFAATYVGIALLVLISLVLFLPAIYIGTVWQQQKKLMSVKDTNSQMYLLFLRAGIAFVAWFIVILTSEEEWLLRNVLAIFAVGFFAYLLWTKIFSSAKSPFNRTEGEHETISIILKKWFSLYGKVIAHGASLMLICFLQFFPVLIFLLILRDAPNNSGPELEVMRLIQQAFGVSVFLQFSGGYLVSSWFNSSSSPINRFLSVLFALLMPVGVAFFCSNPSFIWTGIVQITKIGNFYATELTVNKHACDVITEQGGLCEPVKGDAFKICGAYVMSRIGGGRLISN